MGCYSDIGKEQRGEIRFAYEGESMNTRSTRLSGVRLSFLAAISMFTLATPASAGLINMSAPVFNPGTGSYYAYVTAGHAGITWNQAFTQSAGIKHLGLDGHMVVITSAAENQFLIDNLTQAVIDPSRGYQPLVVSPNPFYQIYEGAAYLAGADLRFLNTLPENDFAFDYDSLSDEEWRREMCIRDRC